MARCPKCGSYFVKVIEDNDLSFIRCLKCGYNELEEGIVSDVRSTQREKDRYTPYKTGGRRRVQ